jgi:hypothetical protein
MELDTAADGVRSNSFSMAKGDWAGFEKPSRIVTGETFN